jgi:hypothetical protein
MAHAPVGAMPIRLTQVTLALGYCGAGVAKILIGGAEWFNGYTLQGIMLGHDGEWSRLFASSVLLCQLQSWFVVGVQALFPIVLLWPRAAWFFVPAATSFHLMTWATMDTGPYMRVWLLLFAFVPLEEVPTALRRACLERGVAGVVPTTVVIAYVGLVGWVANRVIPTWALLSVLVLLLFAFCLHLRRQRTRAPA